MGVTEAFASRLLGKKDWERFGRLFDSDVDFFAVQEPLYSILCTIVVLQEVSEEEESEYSMRDREIDVTD